MEELQNNQNKLFKRLFLVLGIFSFIGILGYGLSYILKMPEISPDGFVPKTIDPDSINNFGF